VPLPRCNALLVTSLANVNSATYSKYLTFTFTFSSLTNYLIFLSASNRAVKCSRLNTENGYCWRRTIDDDYWLTYWWRKYCRSCCGRCQVVYLAVVCIISGSASLTWHPTMLYLPSKGYLFSCMISILLSDINKFLISHELFSSSCIITACHEIKYRDDKIL